MPLDANKQFNFLSILTAIVVLGYLGASIYAFISNAATWQEFSGAVGCACPFLLQAPTRSGMPISQLARIDDCAVATIAYTQPSRTRTLVRRLLNDSKSVKSLVSKVNEVWHIGGSYG